MRPDLYFLKYVINPRPLNRTGFYLEASIRGNTVLHCDVIKYKVNIHQPLTDQTQDHIHWPRALITPAIYVSVIAKFFGYTYICSFYICTILLSAVYIIESVDSISRDERDSPLTQYITNAGISRARYTITHFKHHHRVLWLISNRMSV